MGAVLVIFAVAVVGAGVAYAMGYLDPVIEQAKQQLNQQSYLLIYKTYIWNNIKRQTHNRVNKITIFCGDSSKYFKKLKTSKYI